MSEHCGNHRCQKMCHTSKKLEKEKKENGVDIFKNGRLLGDFEECDRCFKECEKIMSCGHMCPRKCHPGKPIY